MNNNSSPYASQSHLSASDAGFSAYPGANGESGRGSGDGGFRSATPNKKGQYSNAVLDELESQNDEQIGVMSGKVRMLKEVSFARDMLGVLCCVVWILGFVLADVRIVDQCHWWRDQRFYCAGGEDERSVRGHEESLTRHDEPDVAHGGENGRWLEGLGRVLFLLDSSVLVC